jgi:hypothetical protein
VSTPHVCPKCNGERTSTPKASTFPLNCPTCQGSGVVWEPDPIDASSGGLRAWPPGIGCKCASCGAYFIGEHTCPIVTWRPSTGGCYDDLSVYTTMAAAPA